MFTKENLYFIAMIPPSDISDEIIEFKTDFANRFESKAALKVVPHITLKAPFKLPAPTHLELIEWFKDLSISIKSFTLGLNNFGAFHNRDHPVIFIHPVVNQSLHSLQREILTGLKVFHIVNPIDLNFNPHVTVAYRDLKPERFREAWSEYKTKEYKASFEVSDFHLLQHDTRQWNIISTYSLQHSMTNHFNTSGQGAG